MSSAESRHRPESAKSLAERAVEVYNREFASGVTGISPETRALFVPEPVIVPLRAALEGNEYSGPSALEDFAAETRESWDWLRMEAEEIRELDPQHALAVGELIGSGRETGAETRAHVALLYVIRDGKIAEGRTFASEQEAMAAMGK